MEAILLSKLKADTGHELQEWMDLIAKESFEKPTQILHWLKESFNVKHGTAYVLASSILMTESQYMRIKKVF